MRVLFADATSCDEKTLKRLFVLADEIGFMHQPSISFGRWSVGAKKSQMPTLNVSELPIRVSVHMPPEGLAKEYYSAFMEADLANTQFVNAVIDGLRDEAPFGAMFLHPDANYGAVINCGNYYGSDVLIALSADRELRSVDFSGPPQAETSFEEMFDISTHEKRINALRHILLQASAKVSSTLAVSSDTALTPLSQNRSLARLLAVRLSSNGYAGNSAYVTSWLGMSVAESVIPDEALDNLSLDDVMEYRLQTSALYTAWSVELEKLSSRLRDLPPERIDAEAQRIITSEVAPKLLDIRNQLAAARDQFLGDLIKSIAKWEVPALSLAFVAPVSIATALGAVTAALSPAIPSVVDYFIKRRDIKRNNAMTYLMSIAGSTTKLGRRKRVRN
jgi:hypothetical protein